jgi:hypothetical protein
MKRLAFSTLGLALAAAVLLPAAGLAKGASEAQVTGPGLAGPIQLGGSGEPGSGEELGGIAEAAGFFAAVFGQSPNPMQTERPRGALGPRYTITYVMPGPNNEEDTLVQDVYPYAQPHPVTYTKPGQRFWTTERTRGGWYVGWYSSLKDQLVAAGLPPTAPTGGGSHGDGPPWTVLGSVAAVIAIAGLALLAVLGGRRGPGAAPA